MNGVNICTSKTASAQTVVVCHVLYCVVAFYEAKKKMDYRLPIE